MDLTLADRIDALLPQTQCTKCGFDGCRPYAEAIAGGAAAINRCPPGGAAGIDALAQLLGRDRLPLDAGCGREQPRAVALIDESLCIGCTLCIDACPVDAIVGAAKRMHTVLPALCTGCELCVAPCPMDCIALRPVAPPRAWTAADAHAARARFDARRRRLQRAPAQADAQPAGVGQLAAVDGAAPDDDAAARKQAVVQAALERARARRRAQPAGTAA